MASKRILLTGASGNVGIETLCSLLKSPTRSNIKVITGLRNPVEMAQKIKEQSDGVVTLDFANQLRSHRQLTTLVGFC